MGSDPQRLTTRHSHGPLNRGKEVLRPLARAVPSTRLARASIFSVPMRTKLGPRFAFLLALILALGTSLPVVRAASAMPAMAMAATADGTHHSKCDSCAQPQMDVAACNAGICPSGCGHITCGILPSGSVVMPALVLALSEPALSSHLDWLDSPDPPPPKLVTA